jgi:hypothetical protein
MTPLEEKPTKEILVSLHSVSVLFALAAFAATIAWIYYTAKAVEQTRIGGSSGNPDPNGNGINTVLETTNSMFEGTVLAVLSYFVFRHHFNNSHA